jgi:hypothetical protein
LLFVSLLLAGCGASPVADGEGDELEIGDTVDLDTTSATSESRSLPATDGTLDMSAVSGRWTEDPVWCTDQTLGSPIIISATRDEGNEDRCEIADLIDSGDGSFTASLSCEGEDSRETELVKLTPEDGQLRLSYLGRDDQGSTLTRCE